MTTRGNNLHHSLFTFDVPATCILPYIEQERLNKQLSTPQSMDSWFSVEHEDHSRPAIEAKELELRKIKIYKQLEAKVIGDSRKNKIPLLNDGNIGCNKYNYRMNARNKENMLPRRVTIRKRITPTETLLSGTSRIKQDTSVQSDRMSGLGSVINETSPTEVGFIRATINTTKAPNISRRVQREENKERITPDSMVKLQRRNIRSRERSSYPILVTSKGINSVEPLQNVIQQHNKKFKQVHAYEQRNHTLRDVKAWEKRTNMFYYKLSPNERLKVNDEITLWLQQQR